MKAVFIILLALTFSPLYKAQSWQDVGGGTNNSSHGLLVWNGKLVDLGSFNNPCKRVATWNGSTWECLGNGVGIVARAGTIWNGNLVVVGDFWNVFQPCTNCNGIAMWDGTQWTNIGAGFNNDVLCVTVWNGDLVAAGDFTQSNGMPCSRIARWTGTMWEQIGPNNAFNNDIRAITEFDGELWVGGDFSNVGGCTSCDGLVKWNGTSWVGGNSGVDLSGGVDTTVRVLYTSPTDGRLYMGGHFRGLTPNGVYNANLNGVAVYDGSDWFALDAGVGDNPDDYVRAISEYNGTIVVGGYFTSASGLSANKIARFDLSTQAWSAMGQGFDGVGIDEYVKSAAVWDGIFFAGGAYTQAEGGPMNYIAQWYEPPVAEPIAVINAEQSSICAGSCAAFTDNSTYSPTSWNWSFPGATITSSTAQNPPPICYTTAGTYTVTLQACNLSGCNTTTKTIVVNASATVAVNSPTVCSGSSTLLTANPSITGGSFLWSPGGETTSSISVSPIADASYTVTYTSPGCGTASATSNVTVVSAPTVSVNNATICEGASVNLTATPSSGSGTYLWSPGGATTATITVNPSSTTSYSVVYSLGNCNSSPATSTVTVNTIPQLTVTNATICSGQTATLTATPTIGPGTYLWSPNGETTQSISVSPSSTASYSVVYTSSGCSSSAVQGTVTVNPIPLVTVNNLTLCSGNSGTITALPSLAGGNFLWSPGGEITPSITVSPLVNSSYSVSYTLNGCTSNSASSSVTVVNQPTLTSNSETICSGSTVTLTANPSVGGGTYSWSPGGQTTSSINVNPTLNATYTVTYTITGCPATSSTSTVTVNQTPSVTVNNLSLCSGNSGTITALPSLAGGNFLWSPGGEITPSITVSPLVNSSYSVSYTLNGCTSNSASSSVTVVNQPTLTSNSETICSGSSVTLTANPSVGGGTYSWNPGGQTTSSINVNPTLNATYTVTYTITGCPAASSTSTVTVNQTPSVTVNNESICEGDQAILSAIASPAGGNFLWSPGGETTQSITVSPTLNSNYEVSYTLNGCSSPISTSAVTVLPAPDLNVSVNNNILTASQSGGTYQWLDCNNGNQPVSGETDQNFIPSVNGSYCVQVTLNGCSGISNCSIISTIGLDENIKEIIKISPNPTGDNIMISVGSEYIGEKVEISDLNGKTVRSYPIIEPTQFLELSDLSPGSYMIRFNGQIPVTKRLIKL